jgi:DNA-binding NarL/FixJ family response regulator
VLAIATAHINNLYSLFDRVLQPRGNLVSAEEVADRFPTLSKREGEVLMLQNLGLTAPEIAARLFVSDRTVESHIAHVYEKLDVHGRREAIDRVRGQCFRDPDQTYFSGR